MKNLLLTGGSGFIGRNICESYLSEKYNIIAPSHSELDLSDEKSLDDFFNKHSVDIVIHAAVKPGHRNAEDQENLFYTNTRMFFNLERKSHEYQKMIVLGSGAVYDNRYYSAKMVESEYNNHFPLDDHGFCKYVCEKVIEKSNNIYDLRIFGIFGKYEDYSIRFISNMICKALFDLPLTMHQNRNFDYLYIDDLMPVLEYFIDNKPKFKAYNITPKESISLTEIAGIVLKIAGKDLPLVINKDGIGLEYSGDNSRLSAEIRSLEFTPINQSIESLYTWYKENLKKIEKSLLLVDK